jgi:hypothetical protein
MVIRGRVQNGVVVLEGGPKLPDGTELTVSSIVAPLAETPPVEKRRVEVPLVRTDKPGSVDLTAERIAEILEEEDLAMVRPFMSTPKSRRRKS